jgi:hypothetical protein
MPQLHLYVPQGIADEIERRAEANGLSTSKYLASLVEREVREGWPDRWFERVVGKWAGPLVREQPASLDQREDW